MIKTPGTSKSRRSNKSVVSDLKSFTLFESTNVLETPQRVQSSSRLETLSPSEQEAQILREFLFVLLGFPSQHISTTLEFHPKVPQTMASSLSCLKPLVEASSLVQQFIKEKTSYESGKVVHSLTASLRVLLKEFHVQVATFKGNLNALLFAFNETMAVFCSVAQLLRKIWDLKGAQVLNEMQLFWIKAGNPQTKYIYESFLDAALVPYTMMLRAWLYQGQIDDPFGEFFIRERKLNDNYMSSKGTWEYRYTLSEPELIPFFINDAAQVLETGKYFNVVRECGEEGDKELGAVPTNVVTMQSLDRFGSEINAQNAVSNTIIMDLFKRHGIEGHFDAMRKVMFELDLRPFFDHCIELKHFSKDVDKDRVRRLFESVINVPQQVRVEFNETCVFDTLKRICAVSSEMEFPDWTSSKDIIEVNNGLLYTYQTFSLNYHVQFPVSLILNMKLKIKYQLLFRFLFLCKYIHWKLDKTWAWHMSLKSHRYDQEHKQNTLVLFEMKHFLDLSMSHFYTVLERTWKNEFKDLKETMSETFVDTCLKEWMLTNTKILSVFQSLLTCIHDFCGASVMKSVINEDDVEYAKEIIMDAARVEEMDISEIEKSFREKKDILKQMLMFYGSTETYTFHELAFRLD